MKTLFAFPLFMSALLLLANFSLAADDAKAPDARPKLAVVVVSTLQNEHGAITAFDRLDMAFQEVALKRKWPMAIEAERFAANTPAHDVELRIFNQPIRQELPGELTFRGWMILTDHGVKHDFGIVSFRYNPRPAENMDDVLEKIFRGAANAAADKIEPILFPKPAAPKS